MGSIRDRIVWRHHSSRNLPARRRTILAELLKDFLEKVGTDSFEVVAEQIAQPEVTAALAPRFKGLNITTDLMQVGKVVTGQQSYHHGQGLRATFIVLP